MTFILIVFCVVLWFSGKAAVRLYSYYTLTAHASLSRMDWSIREISSDHYAVEAHYEFLANEAVEKGDVSFDEPPFRNTYAAEVGIKAYEAQNWTVWYNPNHPSNSSLQKKFPYKECISAALLWVLLFYFVWLGHYYATKYTS